MGYEYFKIKLGTFVTSELPVIEIIGAGPPNLPFHSVWAIDVNWVKDYVKLWSKSQISDIHYYSSIQVLIENDFIKAEKYQDNISKITYIPSWFKETSLYWYQEKITDAEYFDSIEYLIERGVIKIDI